MKMWWCELHRNIIFYNFVLFEDVEYKRERVVALFTVLFGNPFLYFPQISQYFRIVASYPSSSSISCPYHINLFSYMYCKLSLLLYCFFYLLFVTLSLSHHLVQYYISVSRIFLHLVYLSSRSLLHNKCQDTLDYWLVYIFFTFFLIFLFYIILCMISFVPVCDMSASKRYFL